MGNCCTNENRLDGEGPNYKIGETPRETKKPVSNLKSTSTINHAPQGLITKADSMNKTEANVEKILKSLKKFQHKEDEKNKFQDLPELGPYTYPDGETYLGQYNEGDREGFGIQIWPDGSYYEGYWLADKFSGNGRFIHKEGDYYIGEWKEGMANGTGKLVHVDGSEYEGDWVMDEKSGKGKQVWADGSRYEGSFKNNSINGFGNFLPFLLIFRYVYLDR